MLKCYSRILLGGLMLMAPATGFAFGGGVGVSAGIHYPSKTIKGSEGDTIMGARIEPYLALGDSISGGDYGKWELRVPIYSMYKLLNLGGNQEHTVPVFDPQLRYYFPFDIPLYAGGGAGIVLADEKSVTWSALAGLWFQVGYDFSFLRLEYRYTSVEFEVPSVAKGKQQDFSGHSGIVELVGVF